MKTLVKMTDLAEARGYVASLTHVRSALRGEAEVEFFITPRSGERVRHRLSLDKDTYADIAGVLRGVEARLVEWLTEHGIDASEG